jgi:hypothetical protein
MEMSSPWEGRRIYTEPGWLALSLAQRLVSKAAFVSRRQPRLPLAILHTKLSSLGGLEDLDLRSPKPWLTADSKGGPWEQHFIEGHLSSFGAAYISSHRHALRHESP